MTENEFKKMIECWLIDLGGKSIADIARDTEETPANLQKKIRNQSIRYTDLAKIVEHYGYTIEIRKK